MIYFPNLGDQAQQPAPPQPLVLPSYKDPLGPRVGRLRRRRRHFRHTEWPETDGNMQTSGRIGSAVCGATSTRYAARGCSREDALLARPGVEESAEENPEADSPRSRGSSRMLLESRLTCQSFPPRTARKEGFAPYRTPRQGHQGRSSPRRPAEACCPMPDH